MKKENMLPVKRHEEILRLLSRDGSVRVKDLALAFQVSEDLIRKDLAGLEAEGKLHRKYGGAVSAVSLQHRIAGRRRIPDMEAKKRIASRAMSLLEDGMVIFLDISTTNLVLAEMIAASSLTVTVVTNMIDIMSILSSSPVHLIALGGELDYGREGFAGPMALSQLEDLRFDLAFVGTSGIEMARGKLTCLTPAEGEIKKKMIGNAWKAYVVCEIQKLHLCGNYCFADLEETDGLILDQKPDQDVLEQLEARMLEVIA